jgi:hypothetical protein
VKVHSVSVNLDPKQLLAGWREKSGMLFLPALSETRVGDEVAVRVGLYGHAIRATLFGKVALVRRMGRPALPPGIDLQLERNSLAAVGFLAAAARGEPIRFQERAARYSSDRKLVLVRGGADVQAQSINVSDGGCAVRWPGQLPLVGDELGIRLKNGLFGSTVRAVVCWNEPGAERERTVGLKVLGDGRGARAWRTLVEDVAKAGARVM